MPDTYKGIRLSDIYGDKYNKFKSDNKDLIENEKKYYFISPSDDEIASKLFVNNLAKTELGDSLYNEMPKDNWQESYEWFKNKKQEKETRDSLMRNEIAKPDELKFDAFGNKISTKYDAPKESNMDRSLSELYFDGDLPPTRFSSNYNNYTLKDWFFTQANLPSPDTSIEDRQLYSQEGTSNAFSYDGNNINNDIINSLKSEGITRENGPDVASRLLGNYNNARNQEDIEFGRELMSLKSIVSDGALGKNISEFSDSEKENHVNAYYNRILDVFNNKKDVQAQAFYDFEKIMKKNSPQYRNYHDTEAMPFTPNEMQKIMAKYYALQFSGLDEEADNFVYQQFQQKLSDSQGILEKAQDSILGFTNNAVGNVIATAGVIANAPEALYRSLNKVDDIEDTGWLKEFFFYAAQNPLTDYGGKLMTTGTYSPSRQELYRNLGFIPTQLQANPGEEDKFFNKNIVGELIQQQGFTASAILTGNAMAKVLMPSLGALGSEAALSMLSNEANFASRALAKAINTATSAGVTMSIAVPLAMAEASVDANQLIYDQYINRENAIYSLISQQLDREFKDGTFDNWYRENSRISPKYIVDKENGTMSLDPESQELLEAEYNMLAQQYQEMRAREELSDPKVMEELRKSALRAGANVMFDETLLVALGDALLVSPLGAGFSAAKRSTIKALKGAEANRRFFVDIAEDGAMSVKPTVQKAGNWYAKHAPEIEGTAMGLLSSAEEAVEEGGQNVSIHLREDLFKHRMQSFFLNKYDGITDLESDGVFDNLKVAQQSIGTNLFSDEGIKSMLMGFVSAAIGSPTLSRGVKSTYAKSRYGVKPSFSDFWQNPIMQNIEERRDQVLADEDEAKAINRWISENKDVDIIPTLNSVLNFLEMSNEALTNDDKMSYLDGIIGHKAAIMALYSKLEDGSTKKNLFESKLKTLTTPQGAREVLDRYRAIHDDYVSSDNDVLNEIMSKAKEDYNMYKNMQEIHNIIDDKFHNNISSDTKDILTFSALMRDSWKSRINDIVNEAKQAVIKDGLSVSPISEEDLILKKAIARYGTKSNVEEEISKLEDAILNIKNSKRKDIGISIAEKKSLLNKLKNDLSELKSAKNRLSADNPIITAEEILSMDNESIALLLDENSKAKFSKAQLDEIARFTGLDNVSSTLINSLKDAGRMQNLSDYFKSIERIVETDPQAISDFDSNIRQSVKFRYVSHVLDDAKNADTFDEFDKAINDALDSNRLSFAELMDVGNDVFGNKKETKEAFNRFIKNHKNNERRLELFEKLPTYRNLSDEEKNILRLLYSKAQSEKIDNDSEKINNLLTSDRFKQILANNGIEFDDLTNEDLQNIAEIVNSTTKEMNSYTRVAQMLEDQKKLREEALGTSTQKPAILGSRKFKIIDQSIYNQNKDYYNSILSNITDYIIGKTKSPNLSKSEFIDFIKLFGNEQFSYDILGDDFSTELTYENLKSVKQKLSDLRQDYAATHENATDDAVFNNTHALCGALANAIRLISLNNNSDAKSFFSNVLSENFLEVRKAITENTKQSKRYEKLGSFTTKRKTDLKTETEKKWYENNNVDENLKTVYGLSGKDGINPNQRITVFIRDEKLEADLKEELQIDEFNSNDLPVATAMRVKEGTKNSFELEGHWYIYTGILQNSKDSASEKDNTLNAIRDNMILKNKTGIYKITNNLGVESVYISKGCTALMSYKQEDKSKNASLRDYLLGKYKGDKQQALDDLLSHIVIANFKHNKNTGETIFSYEKEDEVNPEMVTIESRKYLRKSSAEIIKDEYMQPVYIYKDEAGVEHHLMLFVKGFDSFSATNNDEKIDLYEWLNNDDIKIEDTKYTREDVNPVRRAINTIYSTIRNNKKDIKSNRALIEMSKQISKNIQHSLNLNKLSEERDSSLRYKVTLEGDTLKCRIVANKLSGVGNAIEYTDEYGDAVLASLKITDKIKDSDILKFAREVVKNTIYDDNGDFRLNKNGFNLIKPEINYHVMSKRSKIFSKEDTNRLLLNDVFQYKEYRLSQEPDQIKTLETNQDSDIKLGMTGNKQSDTINALNEFIDQNQYAKRYDTYNQRSNSIGVTTFIDDNRYKEEDPTQKDKREVTMAMGTSVDQMWKVYRRIRSEYKRANNKIITPDEAAKKIDEYLQDDKWGSAQNKANTWFGFKKNEIKYMLNEFERIYRFIDRQSNDQIILDADYTFNGEIKVNDKVINLIAKPDILTVDKNGRIHVYDMKSFFYSKGNSKIFNNKLNIEGFGLSDKMVKKWSDQLNLYREIINSKLNNDLAVASISIVPVRLGYNPEGCFVDKGFRYKALGGIGKIMRRGNTRNSKVEVSFLQKNGNQPTLANNTDTATRCYDEVISVGLTKITDISPDNWGVETKASSINRAINDITRKEDTERVSAPIVTEAPIISDDKIGETPDDVLDGLLSDLDSDFDILENMDECNF